MKKIMSIILLSLFSILLFSGCTTNKKNTTTTINYREVVKDVDEIILKEEKASFDFFWETANKDITTQGYGLIPDRYPSNNTVASIASVGYGLTAIPIGIENSWISYDEGYERTLGTLKTIDNLEKTHGFYYHFIDMKTGKRVWNCEVSIIDTAILINGILFSGKYFGGEVETLANKLYSEVEWDWYHSDSTNKFYMGYKPETGHFGSWDVYAEQLMIFVLASGSPTHRVDQSPYYMMKYVTKKQGYNDIKPFYVTNAGTLFTYQFSHAWIDFRNIEDKDGVNWFNNSVSASKAAVEFAKDMSDKYKTLHESSWGMTASDGPNGYNGSYGNLPSGGGQYIDGTVAPSGAIGSIVFTPEDSIRAMKNYASYDKLWGKYGFADAYNLGTQDGFIKEEIKDKIPRDGWFNTDVIGIDKGISLLMIENYRSDFVWNVFMDIDFIQKGLENLQFKEIE